MPKPWKPSRKATMAALVMYEGSGDTCTGKRYLCDSCKKGSDIMRRALIAAAKIDGVGK